jgi:hypothetical protein
VDDVRDSDRTHGREPAPVAKLGVAGVIANTMFGVA